MTLKNGQSEVVLIVLAIAATIVGLYFTVFEEWQRASLAWNYVACALWPLVGILFYQMNRRRADEQ